LTDNEDVAQSSGKRVAHSVFDVDDIETTGVSDSGLDSTNSSQVTATNDLTCVTGIEFYPVGDFTRGEVNFDGVTDFAVWVGVSDVPTVVGDEGWDTIFLECDFLDPTEFI